MHPKFLSRFNWESKCENNERIRSQGTLLGSQHFGVEGHVGVSGWGLKRAISKSITHMDLHKPNNKLVSAQLEHVWCINEPQANTDSQDSPRLEFGQSHHLPPYSTLCAQPWGQHPNVILSRDSQVGVQWYVAYHLH